MSLFGTLTAIGGAIASTASAIGAPVASLASALGASAGTAGTIGTVAGSTALGSASGAALSAATGGDPGQGAWMGAVTGGVTAGAGAALGGSGGAAGGITGQTGQAVTAAQPSVEAITKGVATPGFEQAAKGIQGAAEVAALDPSVSAITKGVATPAFQQASQAAAANAAGSGGLGSFLSNDFVKSAGVDLAKEGIGSGVNEIQRANASAQGRSAMNFANAQAQREDEEMRNRTSSLYSPSGGLGGGKGLGKSGGGSIRLQDGQFIIPADVVSALGNGSTKAGAKFLNDFFSAG